MEETATKSKNKTHTNRKNHKELSEMIPQQIVIKTQDIEINTNKIEKC